MVPNGWRLAGLLVAGCAATGCGEDLDYAQCYEPDALAYQSQADTILQDPDTERFVDMLRASYDAGGYGDAIEIVDASMVRYDIWTRFCVETVFRVDWYASRTRTCFDRQIGDNEPLPDEAMQSSFDTHVGALVAVPSSIVELDEVEDAANGCHRDVFDGYVPCASFEHRPSLEVTFQRSTDETECNQTRTVQTVTVDLVSGAVVECETHQQPVCMDGMG